MGKKFFNIVVVFLAGFSLVIVSLLFLSSGCSTPAVSKPQESTLPQQAQVTTNKQIKETSSSPPATQASQSSSLEAERKGISGKGADVGPLRDVNFDFDRYDLRPDAREILKQHAAWLNSNPQVKVEIEGHCDDRGTNEYNLALGAKRANSVKQYLVDLGVAGRLSIVSYGEELPLCRDENEACWARNRRGHFAVKGAPTN